jgi:hypothetical protein
VAAALGACSAERQCTGGAAWVAASLPSVWAVCVAGGLDRAAQGVTLPALLLMHRRRCSRASSSRVSGQGGGCSWRLRPPPTGEPRARSRA